jgi:hypothetical protein
MLTTVANVGTAPVKTEVIYREEVVAWNIS